MAFYSVQSQLPTVVFTRRSKDGSYLSNWNLKRYNEYLKAKGDGASTENRWNIRHRPSKQSPDKKLTVTPHLVDFQRVLKAQQQPSTALPLSADETAAAVEEVVVPGVCNRELFHAAVALYDVSLPEITPEILYSTVTEKWARTILLVRDAEETAEEYKVRFDKGKLGRKTAKTQTKTDDDIGVTRRKEEDDGKEESLNGEANNQPRQRREAVKNAFETVKKSSPNRSRNDKSPRDALPPKRATMKDATTLTESQGDENELISPAVTLAEADSRIRAEKWDTLWGESDDDDNDNASKFRTVFSDSSSTSGSDSGSDSEDEDLSVGVQTFFQNVEKRRERRHRALDGVVKPEDVGIENRLIGCATFEKSYCRPGEKVIHLTLVAVHKRHRKIGVGHKLIQFIKDTSLVGTFDAIVVHADNGATEFFKKEGFHDDLVINSQYKTLSDRWTNCTLMCYMPPFVGNTVGSEQEVKAIQGEVDKWRAKSLEAYQALATAMARLNQEVLSLREVIKKQHDSIHNLEEENKKLQKSNRELRESARDSGVDLLANGTAADLNRQMIELTTVIREQVERQFGRRSPHSDGSAEHELEDGDEVDDQDLAMFKSQSH